LTLKGILSFTGYTDPAITHCRSRNEITIPSYNPVDEYARLVDFFLCRPEFIFIAGFGALQSLGKNWSARYEATAESHQGGWDMTENVSGNTGKIDEYGIYGIRLGMTYQFD
jgi:hypothetical protein